jgi:hypothetical protein
MANKKQSIMSKGWLIIGLVVILTGLYQIIITNSLNTIDGANTSNSVIIVFLTITSVIIMIIGLIMTVEWVRFSKFLKQYTER